MSTIHNLKLQTIYFESVKIGLKTAEIRYNDRNFKLYDIMILEEILDNGDYTGRKCVVVITHILDDEKYLQQGYVMLSFKLIES